MKNTGIVRRIDELGRVVIPKEIRKNFKIDKNQAVEMFVEDDSVVIKKFSDFVDENKLKIVSESLASIANCPVLIASKKGICAAERISTKNLPENFILKNMENFSLSKADVLTASKILELFRGSFSQVVVAPVIIDLATEFLIFVLIKDARPAQNIVSLAALAAAICSKI